MPPPTSAMSRKRTRSSNISESNDDASEPSSTSTIVPSHTVPPKRRRNNPTSTSRSNYSLRNRSITPDASQTSIDRTNTTQRYNLRPRSQLSTSHSTSTAATIPHSNTNHQDQTVTQSRQYRFVYISDDDEQPTSSQSSASSSVMNTTLNLITDDEDDTPPTIHRRTARATNHNRTRTNTDPTNSSTTDNSDHSTNGTGHVRLNRAIEIVIDSIQSLEGAVNNFDQLFFSLIYGRLNTRMEVENFEGMIRLSRILNLSFPSRLSQDEIDALPQIKFSTKTDSPTSLLLVEKCPICLTEFSDQEIINKLHCSHLFHVSCISTWLSENDSCPTCRRKVNAN